MRVWCPVVSLGDIEKLFAASRERMGRRCAVRLRESGGRDLKPLDK